MAASPCLTLSGRKVHVALRCDAVTRRLSTSGFPYRKPHPPAASPGQRQSPRGTPPGEERGNCWPDCAYRKSGSAQAATERGPWGVEELPGIRWSGRGRWVSAATVPRWPRCCTGHRVRTVRTTPGNTHIPEEELTSAGVLTPPGVGSGGGGRRPEGPPRLAPFPAFGTAVYPATPWLYGLMRSVSVASPSDAARRVDGGGRGSRAEGPLGSGTTPPRTRGTLRPRGLARTDERGATPMHSRSSEFERGTIPWRLAWTPVAGTASRVRPRR